MGNYGIVTVFIFSFLLVYTVYSYVRFQADIDKDIESLSGNEREIYREEYLRSLARRKNGEGRYAPRRYRY